MFSAASGAGKLLDDFGCHTGRGTRGADLGIHGLHFNEHFFAGTSVSDQALEFVRDGRRRDGVLDELATHGFVGQDIDKADVLDARDEELEEVVRQSADAVDDDERAEEQAAF